MSTAEPTAAATHWAVSSGAARHAVPNRRSSRRSGRVSRPAPGGRAALSHWPRPCPAPGARLGEAGGLHGEHLGVAAARREQLVVAAELGDAPLVEHGNPLGAADGGEPVRDDHRSQAGGEVQEPVVERRLGPDVQLGRRLVEDQDPRSFRGRVERAGQGDPLPLAAGQVRAVAVPRRADGVPPARQSADELQRAGLGRRPFQRGLVEIAADARRRSGPGRRCSPARSADNGRSPGSPRPPGAATSGRQGPAGRCRPR